MNTPVPPPPDLAAAREHFLSLVETLRPDLHKYVSRLVGSAIDGEDIVQEALAKGFYALSLAAEPPALRPWLFRIAKNAALDHLRRYERSHRDDAVEVDAMSDVVDRDPAVVRAAVHTFMALPVSQRTAVILKDVLDESLEDIADHMGTTVGAVKSLLARGRATLAALSSTASTSSSSSSSSSKSSKSSSTDPAARALVAQYVALFNARDWVGVQALLLEEVRLDLVAKSQRRGKSVGAYFGRYAREPDVTLRTGTCEGRPCLGLYRGGHTTPSTLVFLETAGDKIAFIRDYRYVPYLVDDAVFVADID